MTTQLLIESYTPEEANFIVEATKHGNDVYLVGNFMAGNIKNKNNRVYPTEEIARAVSTMMENVSKGTYQVMGELDHPDNLSVSLERVSHIITEMKMQGDYAIGKAKILDTPKGLIAKALIEGGVRLGVSSRGSGDVGHDGRVSGFNFVTADLVSNPSGPGCYPNIIRESYENQKIVTLSELVSQDPSAQKFFKKEIGSFLEKLLKR